MLTTPVLKLSPKETDSKWYLSPAEPVIDNKEKDGSDKTKSGSLA